MLRMAIRAFMSASIAFGVIGIIIVAVLSERGVSNDVHKLCMQALMTSVFIILSSFAVIVAHLSLYAIHVAHKYLND